MNSKTPERHAPAPTAAQAFDPSILTEWASTIMLQHHAARNVVESLCNVFCTDINGMRVPPPWLFAMMLKAYTPAQLQRMREQQQQRSLDPAHISREASRQSAKAWEVHHVFKGYAPACRYCGLSALECTKRGIPLECPDRKAQVPDWL